MAAGTTLVVTSLQRSWRQHRVRAIATIASAVIGMFLATTVLGTIGSILTSIKESSGVQTVDADVIVASRTTAGMAPEALAAVQAASGEGAVVVPAAFANTRLVGEVDAVLTIVGVPPDSASEVKGFDDVESVLGERRLWLSEAYATRHGLEPGTAVALSAPTGTVEFTVAGVVDERVQNDGALAVAALDDVTAAFDRTGIDTVFVRAGETLDDRGALVDALAAAAPAAIVAEAADAAGPEQSSFAFIRQLLGMVTLVGLLTAGTVQFVCWRLVIEDERDTVARLRLLGTRPRALLVGSGLLFFSVTIGAALIAIPLGLVAAEAMTSFAQQVVSLTGLAAAPRAPEPLVPVLGGVAAGLVITTVAWAGGIRSFLKVAPIEAVRGTTPSLLRTRPWARYALAGVALVALAAVVAAYAPAQVAGSGLVLAVSAAVALALGLSVVAGRALQRGGGLVRMAAGRELSMGSGRKAGMIGVLGIALVMAFAMTGVATSMGRGLDSSVRSWTGGDLYVMPAEPGASLRDERFPADADDQLATLPSVASVLPFTLSTLKFEDKNVQVYAWEREGVEDIVDLEVADGLDGAPLWDALESGDVAVSENLAYLHDLDVGDTIELPSPTGPTTPTIVATVEDYTGDTGIVFTTMRSYAAMTGDDRTLDLIVTVADGATIEQAESEIATALAGYPGLITWTGEEMREHLLGLLGQVLSILQMIGIVCLVLSVLVGITTVLASLPGRQVAVSLGRLVGMSRRQVARQLGLEASAVAVLAWLIAVPVGIVAVRVTVLAIGAQNGTFWPVEVPYLFTGALLVAAVVAATVAVLVPSRRLLATPIGEVTRHD